MKKGMIGGLALAAALTGCLDTTEPEERVEVRLAHVAPGAGTYDVRLDGQLLLEALAPLQYTYLVPSREEHTYTFESTDSATVVSTTAPDSGIVAVLLVDAAEPAARSYGLDRVTSGQRIKVIHADTAAADMTVLLINQSADPVDTTRVTLARGAGETLELETGTYGIRIHRGEPAELESLGDIPIRSSDQGFLVIYPPASETARYARFLF